MIPPVTKKKCKLFCKKNWAQAFTIAIVCYFFSANIYLEKHRSHESKKEVKERLIKVRVLPDKEPQYYTVRANYNKKGEATDLVYLYPQH